MDPYGSQFKEFEFEIGLDAHYVIFGCFIWYI